MKKLSFSKLVTLVSYHACIRVTCKDAKDNNPYTAYYCDKLSEETKAELLTFGNVQIGCARPEYAPEQRKTVVFVYDKNIKLV